MPIANSINPTGKVSSRHRPSPHSITYSSASLGRLHSGPLTMPPILPVPELDAGQPVVIDVEHGVVQQEQIGLAAA